ncbi:uncharacterized protein Triagg1_4382 [Trichoderma aggressivum f. europaeum]|uniref:Ankyrin repeat protein n=1 Tax=Trichoderma aggressivum f. europaeum TaxID=173218 RepID=A0AAE1M1J6_9HYPO|nr:hypothetical protein Triagg1_4382 [Trichoderma aggressivum f. europaeum]
MATPVASEAGISATQAGTSEENVLEDAVADEPNEVTDEARFDIIGVHGFHGDEKTWEEKIRDEPDPPSSPDQTRLNRLFSDIAPKGGRFIPFNYDPDEESMGCYTLQGSYRIAHKLLEVVAKSRTPEIRDARRPIYFACQDIGGVIVKTIFFGYPHRSHTIVDLEEQLFWLLSLNNDRHLQSQKMTLVRSLAETISKVNDSFIHTKMPIQARIVNIFSTHDDPTKRIFDKYTATLGIAFEYRLPSVKPHLQLVDVEELDSYAKSIESDEDWLDFTELHNASLRKSLHQASPIYPALNDTPIEYNRELDILSKSDDNHILHIQCTSDADKITESVKSYLSEAKSVKENLYYFRFRSRDVRFNEIPAMLWTFFAQAVYTRPRNPTINSYFPEVCDEYPYEYRRLLHMWHNVVVRRNDSSRLLVLGCFDECDDSVLLFLSEIHHVFTTIEHRLRIVIITTKGTAKDSLIVDTLSKFPTENITRIDYNLPTSEPLHDGFNVSMLLQQSHYYAVNGLRDKIEALLSSCSNDESLRHLLIEYFKSTPDPSISFTRILARSQTPSPELIFATILENIPEKYRLWAQKLLSWMLSSFRRLRVSEFCRISDLCLGDKVDAYTERSPIRGHITTSIRQFGGLLVIVHDEVHFSHASIRYWLKFPGLSEDQSLITKGWYQQTERDRHMTIMQTCLEHLKDNTDQSQAWATQLPYATEFWVSHYKQVDSMRDVLDIFEHQSWLERWIDAYMALPTPFLKPFKNYKPLTIAAHFGFEDIVKSILEKNEYDSETLNLALIQAARTAQLPIFRLLIVRYTNGLDLNKAYVQATLQAALRSESHELCHELLIYVYLPGQRELRQQQPPEQRLETNDGLDIKYPVNDVQETTKEETIPPTASPLSSCLKSCLRLACELDMTDIVAKLLSIGPDNDTTILETTSDDEDSPLQVAVQYSRLESAKLLIAAGTSVAPNSNREIAAPLEVAASHGSSDMTNLLLSYGAPIDSKGLNEHTPLQMACTRGNFAAAESLLRHRDFRDYITPDLPSQPLMIAVQRGHHKITEALLRHGADPNAGEDDGRPVLWWAVMKERIDNCRLLLAHKADPNLVLKEREGTPLVIAIMLENMELVKLLVENGADVNQKIDYERTPVYMATYKNHVEIVRYLLSHNADPNITWSNGITPLWHAARQGYSEIVRLLIEAKADIHARNDEYGWTALHTVFDSTETVRVLLEYGADINKMDKREATPLGLGINSNQVNAVKMMLSESKIEPNWSIPSTQRAIRRAVRDGYTDIVSSVLEAGANVDLVDDDNTQLAFWAMSRNDDNMIRTLIEFGADLSHKDKDGDTALHNIRKQTPLASIRRVVNAGGKLDAMNNDLETPLISAIRACNMEVFNYFMTKTIVVDTLNNPSFNKEGAPLHFACARGTLDMVKALIKNGADVNYACASAYGTPLIAASRRWGDDSDIPAESIIRLLLDEGADPKLSAGRVGYPIISASISCSSKVIQLLLDHKASTDVKDPFGRKAAHFACHNTLEVLNSLNLPDSDFAARDIVGRVPLHYAVFRGQLDLVEEVLARSQRVGIDIDVVDDDGWTPLLWAARAPRLLFCEKKLQPSQYEATVAFLLSKGANPSIRGLGLYKEWTVSEVAYYHHADRSKSDIAPQDEFIDCGYDWDEEDEEADTASKAAQSANGEIPVKDQENVEIQFDDEVVEEEDMEL